jgi:anti-sigma factor RsiW
MKGHMNNPSTKLLEASWQRELSPAELAELRAWLAAHPEARADWEADAALSRALARLPDAPMPSNFTARVLQAVELEQATQQRTAATKPRRSWLSWLPQTALASVFIVMGLMAFREATYQREQRFARSLKTVTAVAALPGPDVLQDFEAIQQLSPPRSPDLELLALYK